MRMLRPTVSSERSCCVGNVGGVLNRGQRKGAVGRTPFQSRCSQPQRHSSGRGCVYAATGAETGRQRVEDFWFLGGMGETRSGGGTRGLSRRVFSTTVCRLAHQGANRPQRSLPQANKTPRTNSKRLSKRRVLVSVPIVHKDLVPCGSGLRHIHVRQARHDELRRRRHRVVGPVEASVAQVARALVIHEARSTEGGGNNPTRATSR